MSTDVPADPQNAPVKTFAVDLEAPRYEFVIEKLVRLLKPETYFEIGTSTGASLEIPQCHCISVDPCLRIDRNVLGTKEVCQFFQMPSDRFFAKYDPAALFGGPIEMAFLDGMHLYEFLLRDFINTEKCCRKNSVIMMHDCVPSDRYMAVRDELDTGMRSQSVNPEWWTGDVWKIVPILRKFRPDLRLYALNAPPTGLLVVTNLNPASRILDEAYFEILDTYREGTPTEPMLADYLRDLKLVHPAELDDTVKLARYFWL